MAEFKAKATLFIVLGASAWLCQLIGLFSNGWIRSNHAGTESSLGLWTAAPCVDTNYTTCDYVDVDDGYVHLSPYFASIGVVLTLVDEIAIIYIAYTAITSGTGFEFGPKIIFPLDVACLCVLYVLTEEWKRLKHARDTASDMTTILFPSSMFIYGMGGFCALLLAILLTVLYLVGLSPRRRKNGWQRLVEEDADDKEACDVRV